MFDDNQESETFYDLDKFNCPSCDNIFDATCHNNTHYDELEEYKFKCDKCGQKFKSQAQCSRDYDVTFNVTIVD